MAKGRCCYPYLLGGAAYLVAAVPALAQSAAPPAVAPQTAPPVPDRAANIEATAPQQPEPTFNVFGIRIGLAAPVPPPYEATSFNNLAGQPMTTVDQVMSQQFTGQEK